MFLSELPFRVCLTANFDPDFWMKNMSWNNERYIQCQIVHQIVKTFRFKRKTIITHSKLSTSEPYMHVV